MLGVSEVERFEAYLGLPTLVGRSKYHTIFFLKDSVEKTTRVERKNSLTSKKGDSNQSSGSIDSYVCHECISVTS